MSRLMLLPAFMLAIAVSGCGKDGDTEETDAEETCAFTKTTFPGSSATNVYYRTTIEAKYSPSLDSAAQITVEGVTGTQTTRGNTVVFTPSAPLAPSTSYNVTITDSCGDSNFSFTTSEVGATVSGDLVGNTYALDLQSDSVRFVHPEGVGDLLGQYLTTAVLVGVQDVSTNVQMIGAIGADETDPPEQDMCTQTIPFPEADFTGNPFFEVGPADTMISVQGYDITIDELRISGSFAPDGSYISGATLSGSIDTRPLVPLLDDSTEPDENAICELAGSIGVTCEACATDGGMFCLSLEVDGIPAALIADLELVELATEDDVCANPACAEEEICTQPE